MANAKITKTNNGGDVTVKEGDGNGKANLGNGGGLNPTQQNIANQLQQDLGNGSYSSVGGEKTNTNQTKAVPTTTPTQMTKDGEFLSSNKDMFNPDGTLKNTLAIPEVKQVLETKEVKQAVEAAKKGSKEALTFLQRHPGLTKWGTAGLIGILTGLGIYGFTSDKKDDKTTDPTGGTDDNKGGGGNNNNKGGGGNNINRDLYDPIVRRVIRGEFGNGAQRQRALTQMGYDWNDIQGQVNHALGFNGHVRDYLGGGTSSGNGGYSNTGYSNGGYNYTPTNTYKNPNAGKSGYYDFMGQFHETGDMDQNAYNQSQLTSMQQNQKWYESQRNEIVPGTNMTKDELFRQAYEKAKDSNDPSVQQALAQVADELGYNYQYGNTSGLNRGDFIENAGINRNAYAQSQGYKDWADYVDWYENRSNAWNSVYGSPVQRPSAEEYNKIWYTAATYNPNTVQQQQQQGIMPQYSMPVYNGPTYSNNPYQYNNVHGQESEYITLDRNNWLYAGMPQYLKDTQGGNQNLGGNKYYYSL